MNYIKCYGCEEIIKENEIQHSYIRGSKDSAGFQYEPDEHGCYCPNCGCDDIQDMDNDDWFEIIKDLKKEINDNENTIRNQRLKIEIMENEDDKCEMIKRLEKTIEFLKAELYDARYPAVKQLRGEK